jgi:endo-1,4-beta-xylanase
MSLPLRSAAARHALASTPRRLLIAALAAVAACGGSSGGDPVQPVEKTCTQDPSQAKCTVTVTPPAPVTPSTLKDLAAAKGRSFGVALDATFFANNAAYNAVVAREFNTVVAGNVMKWEPLNRNGRFTYRWANPDLLVAFAQANGMKVRGHTLAWYQQNPTWLTSATWSADTLRQLLKEHIDSVVGHYKGKVYAWDVVNEALNDGSGTLRTTGSPWAPLLGRDYIDLAFREARAVDPAAELYYNDYSLEFAGAKQDSAVALIQGMKARGVPIDGIGFQAHFQVNANGTGVPSKDALKATFARFTALGLKIEITELDIRVRTNPAATAAELTAQTEGYANVVAACVETPACGTIVVWGLNDGESWIPGTFPGFGQALLFDDSLGTKATYNSVRSALGG